MKNTRAKINETLIRNNWFMVLKFTPVEHQSNKDFCRHKTLTMSICITDNQVHWALNNLNSTVFLI
jgi:hypothetical protein